jgi:hypothetical protein
MRRPLLLLAVLALACGAAWLWRHPGDLRLRIDPRSREVALILPREAQGLRTSAAVLRALAELAPPEQRETLRAGLGRATLEKAERATVGFVPGQPAELSENPPEVSVGGKVIPGLARVQLSGVPHGYLLVHAAPANALLETAARRRWLGRALIEAGAQAETATIAVGESDGGAFLVVTIAFAYRTGDEAEAALARLTEKQGDYEALGFAARPGTDRITRQTKLLVVRLDIETDLVLQALRHR